MTYWRLLAFEVRDRLARKSAGVYFLVYFALSFLIAITFAGAFKGAVINLGLSNRLALNSPVVLNMLIGLGTYFGLLVVAPLFGQSIYKDYESGFAQILFATPIRKRTYFSVRYLGAAIASLVILSALGLGAFVATFMPFVDRTLVNDNHAWYYLAPYFTGTLPIVLVFGAIFIAFVASLRSMAPVYVASVSIFTGWLVAQSLTGDMDNRLIAALIDPLGLEATSQVIRYWSVAEQSTRVVPITGVLLYNRLLWATVGLLALGLAYASFDPFRSPRRRKVAPTPETTGGGRIEDLPAVTARPADRRVLGGLIVSEFRQVFTNIYFLMILLCGVLYIFSISGEIGKIYGTETLPVTYSVLEVIGGSFGLFVVILTTFYAGEIVWKGRDHRFFELVDAKPVPDLYLYLSKLFALFGVQIFLQLVTFVCCVLIQTFKGYHHYEWGVYFQTLFVYGTPGRLLVCVLALFVQTVAPNKYAGHAIVIGYWLARQWLPALGFDHVLYLVGELPRLPYSDMNGFGPSAGKFTTLLLYWVLLHAVLGILTIAYWRRGHLRRRRRLGGRERAALGLTLAGWCAVGAFVFVNTNVWNVYWSTTAREKANADYERGFKSFQKRGQPEIVGAELQVDVFPRRRALSTGGTLTYRNTRPDAIAEVLVNVPAGFEIDRLEWARGGVTLVQEDRRLNTRVFRFDPPLAAGGRVDLQFATRLEPKGFTNEAFDTRINENGSFFHGQDFAPTVGYNPDMELVDEKSRRKYGLPERPRIAAVDDRDALRHTYVSSEGSWIEYAVTIATDPDQIALAPGYLQQEEVKDGRRYFRYRMDRPILNFHAYQSARYEVLRDEWNGIKLEIYHHPTHTYDLARMMNSVKKSLAYFSKNFSPYQYCQFRIVEFPRYQMFAQAFPNTVPFSEAIGFIAKVNDADPESIDFPFYVTAHEMAHQWWAHQVIGGNVQGATMLSESLAQYSALMVQEKEFGPKNMRKFLKYELDRYLNGRSRETKKELPLALNENQQYIHYNKGSLVFYALKDLIGEDVVNGVLRDFLREHAFRGPPFPRALDLVARLRAVAPEDKKYLIEDLFETITLYDNRTEDVKVVKEGDAYRVTMRGALRKLRADGTGVETEVAMNDWIDVGLFDKEGNIIVLEKRRLHAGENVVEFRVDREPARGGFDPLNKLIDRVSDDNSVNVSR